METAKLQNLLETDSTFEAFDEERERTRVFNDQKQRKTKFQIRGKPA